MNREEGRSELAVFPCVQGTSVCVTAAFKGEFGVEIAAKQVI